VKQVLLKLSRLTVLLALFFIENIRGPPLVDALQPIHKDGVECHVPFTSIDRGWEEAALPSEETDCLQISAFEALVRAQLHALMCSGGWMPHPAYIRARADSEPELGVSPLVGSSYAAAPPPPRVNRIPYPKRIDVGHVEGKGIGYEVGYSQLAVVLGPEYQVGKFLPLGELRGMAYDDGTLGANVGFIGRYLPESLCQVYGFNLFYDFREGPHLNHSQLGGGLEVLSRRWEVHADVNFGVGRSSRSGHYQTCVYDYPGDFHAVVKCYEFVDSFVDARAGYYPVVSDLFQLYVEAGPYYIFGKHASAFGGKASIRPQLSDWFSVVGSVSHDPIFDTIWQVNVVFTLPLYNFSSLKNKTGPCGVTNRQIYQPIDRDMILRKRCCWQFNW